MYVDYIIYENANGMIPNRLAPYPTRRRVIEKYKTAVVPRHAPALVRFTEQQTTRESFCDRTSPNGMPKKYIALTQCRDLLPGVGVRSPERAYGRYEATGTGPARDILGFSKHAE